MRRLAPALVLLALAAAGCSGGSDELSADPTPSAPTSTAPAPAPSPPTRPAEQDCYALTYREAVAPTTTARPVPCGKAHTALTYAVGTLDTVVAGHLLAVDSRRVQAQVAAACPDGLAEVVGGTDEDRRLSMLRPVWFTPTVSESDAGADWYRCDVVALAADEELAPLDVPVDGVLDTEAGRDRYGMCGTAQPGNPAFQRVICTREHTWRAIAVVPLQPGPYPGEAKVREAGQTPCQDAGAAVATDDLDYQWGYEWPTAEQWRAGQTFGRCWAPD